MAITFTKKAARRIQHQIATHGNGIALRVGIKKVGCTGMAHTFEIANEASPTDHSFESHGARILITDDSFEFLDGSHIDFVTEGLKQTFKFDNPSVESECGCGESFNLKKTKLDAKNPEVTS
jgi:iron-sulfur cluster assembly protein